MATELSPSLVLRYQRTLTMVREETSICAALVFIAKVGAALTDAFNQIKTLCAVGFAL